MDLTSLSADDPIGLLSNDPDKFFGRTTKVQQGCCGWPLALQSTCIATKLNDLTQPQHWLPQALDVTAEPDGAPATVSENRPLSHRHHAALKWPAILGLCLGSMVLLFAAGRFWRRRSRRMLSWLGSVALRVLPVSPLRGTQATGQILQSSASSVHHLGLGL